MLPLRLLLPASLLAACLPQGLDGSNTALKQKNAERFATNSESEIRSLCLFPEVSKKPYYLDWTDKKITKKSCAWLKAEHDKGMAKTESEARQLGGVGCLERVDAQFARTKHEPKWEMPFETAAARREVLSKIAEPCVAELETSAKAGKHQELYLALMGHERVFSAECLTEAQRTRLKPLITTVPAGASKAFEARAAVVSADYPLAAALYLASAALAAHAASDAASRERLVKRARDLVTQAGPLHKLSVSLVGELAPRVKKRAGSDFSFVDNGEVRLAVKLLPPTTDFGEREVVRSATHRIQRGTKANPAVVAKKGQCNSLERDASSKEKSCAKDRDNGHPDGWAGSCMWASKYRERADKCSRELSRMPQEVEAFAEEEIKYDATEFFGTAKGALELTSAGTETRMVPISVTVTNLRHGTIPVVNLPASRGGKVAQDEVIAKYESTAVAEIISFLRADSDRLAQSLLAAANEAQDEHEGAAALVRYTLMSSTTPGRKILDVSNAKLKLPLNRALDVLLAAKAGNNVAW
ncbi:MAG: hypothetical protein SFX73_12370 [Kofleriaceae bacterium]|nr:hypothetical protein [Kofleriaceae bacterium]